MSEERKAMRYGSVCSGIEAATVAWHPLGWEPAFFSEIEAFPRAVLAHHYPNVPLHGDFTTIEENQYGKIDVLVGGTPCQSFSIAGLRNGLDDNRGNLALEFCRLAQRERPRWIVWENVPGVLSSNGGRDFGSILGALEDIGYGLAYRVLDAQYFGVAQRRRRVFVVGYLGDWRPAAAVLFERHSMSGRPAPSREARKEAARGVEFGPSGGRFTDVNPTLDARAKDGPIRNQLAGAVLQPWPADAAESKHVVTVPTHDVVGTLCAEDSPHGARGLTGLQTMLSGYIQPTAAFSSKDYGVRRLTPVECERLQGFPDNFTAIPWRKKGAEDCPDGPRYKALGNSMAVPVMRWIGERIAKVEALTNCGEAE